MKFVRQDLKDIDENKCCFKFQKKHVKHSLLRDAGKKVYLGFFSKTERVIFISMSLSGLSFCFKQCTSHS